MGRAIGVAAGWGTNETPFNYRGSRAQSLMGIVIVYAGSLRSSLLEALERLDLRPLDIPVRNGQAAGRAEVRRQISTGQ